MAESDVMQEAGISGATQAVHNLLRRDQELLQATGASYAQVDRHTANFVACFLSHPLSVTITQRIAFLLQTLLSKPDSDQIDRLFDVTKQWPGAGESCDLLTFTYAAHLGLGPVLDKMLDDATLVRLEQLTARACLSAGNEYSAVAPTVRAQAVASIVTPVTWIRYHLSYDQIPLPLVPCSPEAKTYEALLDSTKKLIDQLTVHSLLQQRLTRFQSMVLAFPQSTSALNDMQICLSASTTDSLASVAHTLLVQWNKGLLLPSTPTDHLVEFFVLLVHSCRACLDDGGQVLLSHLVPTLRAHLRARPDTIDVIVAALLGKGATCQLLRPALTQPSRWGGIDPSTSHHPTSRSSPWYDSSSPDLADPKNLTEDREPADEEADARDEDDSDDDAAVVGHRWNPRPIHAGPAYRRAGSADVVALLVSIFTDRQGFVAALERAFATQLLCVKGYDTSEQRAGSIALRQRFGSQALQNIEIMLADIEHSSSLSNLITSSWNEGLPRPSQQQNTVVEPTVISRQCWPDLTGEPSLLSVDPAPALRIPGWDLPRTFRLPSPCGDPLDGDYRSNHQENQSVITIPRLGTADVRVTMDDGRVVQVERADMAQVGVLHVALRAGGSPEGSNGPVSVPSIMEEMRLDRASARRALFFWCAQGVLREMSEDVFVVVEHV